MTGVAPGATAHTAPPLRLHLDSLLYNFFNFLDCQFSGVVYSEVEVKGVGDNMESHTMRSFFARFGGLATFLIVLGIVVALVVLTIRAARTDDTAGKVGESSATQNVQQEGEGGSTQSDQIATNTEEVEDPGDSAVNSATSEAGDDHASESGDYQDAIPNTHSEDESHSGDDAAVVAEQPSALPSTGAEHVLAGALLAIGFAVYVYYRSTMRLKKVLLDTRTTAL